MATLPSKINSPYGWFDVPSPPAPKENATLNEIVASLYAQQVSPYAQAVQTALTKSLGWGPKQQKYSDRFGEYFKTAEEKLGEKITSIQPISFPKQAGDPGGMVFLSKTEDGDQYVMELPYSPGGKFFDYNTAGMPGWESLGLGDLGGEGNEKIPGNSGASFIPLEQFNGLPGNSAIYMGNVNPKGESFGSSLAKLAALAAAVYTGGTALGAWGGGAAAGTAAGATTASGMLAAESAAMLNAGFTAAEVAGSLAGLGNAAQIGSILTAAGVPSAIAGSLATEALTSSGLLSGTGTAAGYTGTAAELAADGLGGVASGMSGATAGYTGTAAELAADGLGGVVSDAAVATQSTAPVVDASLSWVKPGTVANLNGTNYLGVGGGAIPIGAGTVTDAASITAKIAQAGGASAVASGTTGIPIIDSALGFIKDNAGLLGTGANLLGGYLQNKQYAESSKTLADAQVEAARIAADAAKFRPVGVSTRFGSSKFDYDANGNLKSAGYTVDPEIRAQQDQLMDASGGLLNQFTGSQAATAPMGAAGARAMQLGQGYLATDPATQAQKYMAEQQALLATGRERDFSTLQNKLAQQGRLGLATGGTSTGMMAANPEMEAYYNAIRQQDLGLASQATQGGMDYAKFGAGMVGTGGDLLKSMYGVQSAAYNPYNTALGGAAYIEGLGQQPMDMGINIGAKGTAANAQSGMLMAQGMQNAAQTMAPSNANSNWANLLGGIGNYLTQPAQTGQVNPAFQYDPSTKQFKLIGT